MFITKTVAAAPHVSARRGHHAGAAAAGSHGAGADGRRQDGRPTAAPPRVRVRAARRHHGPVDAGGGRRGLRVHADSQAARILPQSLVVVSNLARPEAEPKRNHAGAAASWLAGVRAEANRGSGLQRRHDDRSARRQGDRPGHDVPVARGRDRGFHRTGRRLRPRLQLRLHEHAQLADADDAAADGDQSAAWCSSGCSASGDDAPSGWRACGRTAASSISSATILPT